MTGLRLLLLGSLLVCVGCSGTEETPVFGPGPEVWAGNDPDWAVVYPANGNERLLAACALPSGEAWAVGTGGVALHHVGVRWLREETGTDATLADVATDGRLVCAVGSDGAIIVRESGAWRREASHTAHALRAVAIVADGTAWACDEAGALLRRTGAGWGPGPQPGVPSVTTLVAWGDTLVVGSASGLVVAMAGSEARTLGEFGSPGILRLAVSPSGTLFAAADSLYRYDSGRWITVNAYANRQLAANDNLVFSGSSSWPYGGSDVWSYFQGLGQEVAAICAVGSDGALAVGLQGGFSWLRDGVWRLDLHGGYSGGVVQLADGTACAVLDRQVIVWDDDCWRPLPLPWGVGLSGLVDGLDRSHLLLRIGSNYVLTGTTGSVTLPPPPHGLNAARIAPDGTVVGVDGDGLVAWNGQEWQREDLRQDADLLRFRLVRTRAGELFAISIPRVLRREGGHWRDVARIALPPIDYYYSGNFAAVGQFPRPFAVLDANRWLNWDDRADSLQSDWRMYDPPHDEVRASVSCETPGAVYVLDESTNRLLGLRFAGPEAGSWVLVAGSPPDPVTSLWAEPDGSITAFARSTGRIWRHPAPPRI